MIDTLATVEENRDLAPGYKLLALRFSETITSQPGQFAMVRPHCTPEPLLRRALAIYQADGSTRLTFLYQILGRGTAALSLLQPGGLVDALVPLGNSWPVPVSSAVANTSVNRTAGPKAVVVSGGIGSASLLTLCRELVRASVDLTIFFGAATKVAVTGCGLEDFSSLGVPLIVSTDDGSLGEKGFVTESLTRYLSERADPTPTVYTCGPWKMMSKTAAIAAAFGLKCLASLEAPMGCGFGVCVGCVVAVTSDRTTEPISGYDTYQRVCVDGTIFPAERIRWDVEAMSH